MNISSTLSNSYFNESSHLPSTHEHFYGSSMFSPTTEQFCHSYPYNSNSIPILNYPEYSTNIYNISDDYSSYQPPSSSSFICSQEPIVNTIKIHINPFFRSRSSNEISESSSKIETEQSTVIEHQQHDSSLGRSRSRSLSSDRQVIITPNKKRPEHQFRKLQRQKFIQEKELIFKRQSSLLFSKSKHRRSSSDRWEHKEEKLKRLYKEYSDEDSYKHWNPLLLQECFELCQYALDKFHET